MVMGGVRKGSKRGSEWVPKEVWIPPKTAPKTISKSDRVPKRGSSRKGVGGMRAFWMGFRRCWRRDVEHMVLCISTHYLRLIGNMGSRARGVLGPWMTGCGRRVLRLGSRNGLFLGPPFPNTSPLARACVLLPCFSFSGVVK